MPYFRSFSMNTRLGETVFIFTENLIDIHDSRGTTSCRYHTHCIFSQSVALLYRIWVLQFAGNLAWLVMNSLQITLCTDFKPVFG